MTLLPTRAAGTISAPETRHGISAGILRARTRAWMSPAVTLAPFQHPRLACEVSRRGAMESAAEREGGREASGERKTAAAEQSVSVQLERIPRVEAEKLVQRKASAEQQWRVGAARERGRRRCAGEGRGKS